MDSEHGHVALVASHLKTLRVASIAAWLLTVLLLYVASLLPSFDSSARLVLPQGTLRNFLAYPLLRWDTFHFVHIARDGYVYEHEWAFLPGVPKLMLWTSKILQQLQSLTNTPATFFVADLLGSAALLSCTSASTSTLYHLTLVHFGSPSVAYLTALLSLLPSSPATLRFSACTEPFFTYLSYKGMLGCARSQWLKASLFLALAASFRSNGFMLAGFVVWGLLVEPLLNDKRVSIASIVKAASAATLICAPFGLHQYAAYLRFCRADSGTSGQHPPWCSAFVPSIYNYVQAKYWNVGFLRYWTLAQLPNILLAAPILFSLFSFMIAHLRACALPMFINHLRISSTPTSSPLRVLYTSEKSPFFAKSIIPHVIHTWVMYCILLFAAHTQIALRLAASMPTTYWAAARLMLSYPRAGRWWIGWSVVWGMSSIILWAVFLPPA